jgi:hypothetical protein
MGLWTYIDIHVKVSRDEQRFGHASVIIIDVGFWQYSVSI